MVENNLKTVRGLGIALLVLNILAIIASLIMLLASCAGVASGEDDTIVAGLSVGFVGTWCLIISVLQLVAAVIAMSVKEKPENINKAFGWGIFGIVASVLCTDIVNLILFIILVVKASAVRGANNA